MHPQHWGIPRRMARAIDSIFKREGRAAHAPKVAVIDALMRDDERIPLATSDGGITGEPAIWQAAESAVRDCYTIMQTLMTEDAITAAIEEVCARRGIAPPQADTFAEYLKRAGDKPWWRRHLRTEWKRRFEHTSIQLGLTYVRSDPYVSRETAIMQAAQNAANQQLLEQRTATNENGQSYTVAELAQLGMGNKTLRRGELMTRIRGFEEIAGDLGDIGMFWTVTCPSKFHSVGGTNKNYNGASPRDAQSYLVKVWAAMRAAMHRAGIRPYGFRIAEPHSDGCPHWHMLLFVDKARVTDMEMIVTALAMREDEEEKGAHAARVKLVRIEEGRSAAGYIAKYVSKNIDGAGVGDHKTFEDGRTYVIAPDIFGQVEITPSQRVTYWSQVWGIRQFQQIGGAPVGVWRELRRIKAETIQGAPEALKLAHQACQKIDSEDIAVAKQADFAAYMMAQGGPTVGRRAAIRIAAKEVTIHGRYATYDAPKPVGVYAAAQPEAVYESVRYRWTIAGASSGAAFDLPRTGVNNCTAPGGPAWTKPENAAGKFRKNFGRDQWSRSENSGGASWGGPWSKNGDADQVDRFKKHSARYVEPHLSHLQRKYPDA